MLAGSHAEKQIIARVAALDIAKAELVCCVRVPASAGGKRRLQEVTTYSTMTQSLTELANRLVEMGVQRVVMEATSSYWKPVFYLLEAHGLDPWLVNARDVKHLPGRPKTDVLDAVWLCKVAERQMLRPSFVPPWPIRRLRDLTRYRTDATGFGVGRPAETRRPRTAHRPLSVRFEPALDLRSVRQRFLTYAFSSLLLRVTDLAHGGVVPVEAGLGVN